MPDYAGAEAAIGSRLVANWTVTPIVLPNESMPTGWSTAWPPVDVNAVLLPWVQLEVECFDSAIVGSGRPGAHLYQYEGLISVHVFTPVGSGRALGLQHAVAIGEIFRRKEFYNETSGHAVRTEDPFPAGGSSKSDDGNWWGTVLTVSFVYWFRG